MVIILGASSFIGVYTADELVWQGCKILVTGRNNKFREHYKAIGVEYVNLNITKEDGFNKLPKSRVEA